MSFANGGAGSRLEGIVRNLACVVIALSALVFTPAPAKAEVRWKSGAVSAPAAQGPSALAQAVGELAGEPDRRRIVVHFDGPVGIERRARLEASGLRLLNYLGGFAYFAALSPASDPNAIAAAPGLVAVEAIDRDNKLHPDLIRGAAPPWSVVAPSTPERPVATVAVNVLFHRDFETDDVADVIARYGGIVQSEFLVFRGVVAHLPLDRVRDLAGADAVMYVEPPMPGLQDLNDGNRARVQADEVHAAPYDLDGSGVTVLVYDGGKVAAHDDLAGRLTIGQSDTDGISDHATHVACTIGGLDGSGTLTGMAPATEIVSYSFEQVGGLSQGFLYTDPGDLLADYTEAISLYGADLSNNSIGSNTAPNGFPCSWEGNYGATGALIDEVVRGMIGDPFRVVWANGNERGSGANCGSTYNTTAPPACAKNHLTVGALNSDDDSVTSFTSWGPCDDGRLKPDVSAPGCQSDGDGGVSSCSSSGGYTVKCGTSMASPTTAGVAALLLQQFRESFPTRPDFRNSTLRAILAQTALDIENPGPDFKTGYGSIRARPAADLIRAEKFFEGEVSQGQIYEIAVNSLFISPLRVTLAWDDPAGTPDVNPVLVNDLDLRIIDPGGTVHYPFTLDPGNPSAPAIQTVRDSVNNIEQVLISNPSPGAYRVQIHGFNIADGPSQSFSIASSLTPEFCDAAPSFNGIDVAAAGQSCGEIDLSWAPAQSNCDPQGQISYNVYRHDSAFFFPGAGTLIAQGVGATSMTDVGLDPAITYYYLVRANDSQFGEDGNLVKRSTSPLTGPDTVAPIFDGLGSATPGPTCGEVVLDWSEAFETCSGPVAYDVHRSTDPGFLPGPETRVATTYATAFVDTSVTPGEAHSYIVRATDGAGNAESNQVRLAVSPTLYDVEIFRTAFEPDDAGWTVIAPDDADTGNWEWGDPLGTAYQPEDDDTPAGVNCWVTGIATSPSNGDIDGGSTTLQSAAYDLTGAVNPGISYSRWFTNDRGASPGDATDSLRVDVSSDDGQSWTPLEEVGAGTPLAWVPVSFALPVAATDEVRVRFSAADLGSGSVVEALIDEFRIIDVGQACLQCSEPPAETLCTISADREGDDIRIDWSGNPVTTRAVVYHVGGCSTSERVKLGTTEAGFFVHENAAISSEAFNYRVTFVDECGNEQGFCGATNCP